MAVELVPASEKLSQGDVFAEVPSVWVASLSYMVKVDQNRFVLRQNPPLTLHPREPHQANVREAANVSYTEDPFGNATAVRRHAMVMSHDCEVDKLEGERASVQLALIRELAHVHLDDQDPIRTYDEKRTFYLPSGPYLATETYVDFRVMTTIRLEALEQLERTASLSEDGRLLLRSQLFRFYARKRLPDEWTAWEDERE